MSAQNTHGTRDGPSCRGFIAAAICIAILVPLVGYAVIKRTQGVNLGDAYEGLSALFSGLAFIGVIYALMYQRAELKLQRAELALTREEMVRQRQEMAAQNATLAHQRFENSFFQLLKFQRESMQTLSSNINSGYPVQGSVPFRNTVNYLENNLGIIMNPPLEGEQLLEYIDSVFKHTCASDNSDFSHYFRTLYHLIEFVYKSPIEDKTYYTGLIRAQLSTDQVALFFYNGLSEQCRGFKPLIERYALLKNWRMPKAFQAHRSLYPAEAYDD